MAKIYAVKKGLVPGIYNTWEECKAQVDGYPGALYKSFKDIELSEAINYVGIEHFQLDSTPRFTENMDKRTLKMLNNIDIGFSPAHAEAYRMSTLACSMLKGSLANDPFAPSKAVYKPNDSLHVDIYVDGSFKNNRYSYGFVVVNSLGDVIYSENGLGDNEGAAKMQSVAGELSAAMNAIHWSYKNGYKCRIFHDNKGIGEWAKGSWKAKNKYTKEYVDFIKSYSDIILGFEWVKGHAGNKYNEMADKLAGKVFDVLSA